MARSASTNVSTNVTLPPTNIESFQLWIVGSTPLICHAWSEKARRAMLDKQQKQTREGREVRDPESDFLDSLYTMGDGIYGFPAMAIKNAMLDVAHKDKGVPRTVVMKAVTLDADMVRTRPALAGAICDMPLYRIWGTAPEMREDMVRVGTGLTKTATLAYRAQFTHWAMLINGHINTSQCPLEWVPFLLRQAGMGVGLGEWRAEKRGMFGAFRVASVIEAEAWETFAGGGELPARAA